jgi:hypothetical protein
MVGDDRRVVRCHPSTMVPRPRRVPSFFKTPVGSELPWKVDMDNVEWRRNSAQQATPRAALRGARTPARLSALSRYTVGVSGRI